MRLGLDYDSIIKCNNNSRIVFVNFNIQIQHSIQNLKLISLYTSDIPEGDIDQVVLVFESFFFFNIIQTK